MRSSLVVRASDCQCRSRNSPGFDPGILRHSGIWGAADEAVLNTVHRSKKNAKNPPVNNGRCLFFWAMFWIWPDRFITFLPPGYPDSSLSVMDCDPDPILFLLITYVWYRNRIRIYIITYHFKFKIPVFSHLMQFFRMLYVKARGIHVLIPRKNPGSGFFFLCTGDPYYGLYTYLLGLLGGWSPLVPVGPL
jgi:hypothetical protein